VVEAAAGHLLAGVQVGEHPGRRAGGRRWLREVYRGYNASATSKERAMRYVSATEAEQALAAVLDAAQREPVVIRRQARDVAVVLSVQEYERLTASNVEQFQQFCDRIGEQAKARGLSEEKLSEILADDA
jgi:prevent-host-death family protein